MRQDNFVVGYGQVNVPILSTFRLQNKNRLIFKRVECTVWCFSIGMYVCKKSQIIFCLTN